MNGFQIMILEAMFIAFTLSIDSFTAGFSYGSSKIKIPFSSVQTISIICSVITVFGFLIGDILKDYIPNFVTVISCFIILFVLGIIKLLDGITKSIIRKYNDIKKEIKLSFFNFRFIIILYADPEKADIDSSKIISPTESIALAISLSLDGLAVGISAALRKFKWINNFPFFYYSKYYCYFIRKFIWK